MTAPQKFMFDTSFDDNAVNIDPISELKARFDEKIEKTKVESFEEGRQKGLEEANESISQQINIALEKISQSEQKLRSDFEIEKKRFEAEAIEFGITAGTKLAKELLQQQPESAIEQFFKQAFSVVQQNQILTAKLHPSLINAVTTHYEEWAKEAAFEGKINFVEDQSLGLADVEVIWSNGGIKRSIEDMINSIQKALGSYATTTSSIPTDNNQVANEPLEELTVIDDNSTSTIEKASVNHE